MLLAQALLVGWLTALTIIAHAQEKAVPLAVDLALVLAVDVSNSVDVDENALQRAGYVRALQHPELWAAVQTGVLRRIAIAYVEWAGPQKQRIILPWRLIDSAAAARAAAAELLAPPIMFSRGTGTSISAALLHSAALFRASGFDGRRRLIDISGDGPNNRGVPVTQARDAVVGQGITVNGLPLMLRPSRTPVQLDLYYQDCVIGGPGAFILPVFAADQLALAIRRKLILEIAGQAAPARLMPAQAGRRADCRIGDPPQPILWAG